MADDCCVIDVTVSPMGLPGPTGPEGPQGPEGPGVPPLTADVAYWVDSAAGDDTNDGSQAAPWATLQRALEERAAYGLLEARFQINLVGAGPYIFTGLTNSQCGVAGGFEIRGEYAAKTVYATGTVTGNFDANNSVGTSPGLGTNTHDGRFVRITSGDLADTELQILQHTDTNIVFLSTVVQYDGAVLASGDSFEIFTPVTEVLFAAEIDQCTGGDIELLWGGNYPKHVFRHVKITGSVVVTNSVLGFSTCHAVVGDNIVFTHSRVQIGLCDNALVFDAGVGYAIWGAGLFMETTGPFIRIRVENGILHAVVAMGAGCFLITAVASPAEVYLSGAMLREYARSARGVLELTYDDYQRSKMSVIEASEDAVLLIYQRVEFTGLTYISSIQASGQSRALIYQQLATGTAGAGQYGMRARHNASILLYGSGLPLIPGGTPGADISVQGLAAAANSSLNAANTSVKSTVTNALVARVS